jgi:phage-related protein (TIGR01555 family)
MAEDMIQQAMRDLIKSIPARAGALVKRADGWANVLTGLGTVVDKTANTNPVDFRGLSDAALLAMFHGDSTVRKAVGKRPTESLRLGISVNVPQEAGGVETGTAIQDALDDLGAVGVFAMTGTWENLWGGAAIYVGVDDGNNAADSQLQPLVPERVRKVLWLKSVDRRYLSPDWGHLDTNPASSTFGKPLYYFIQADITMPMVRVHASRLIVFPGPLTTPEVRAQRNGWGISALDPVYEALQRLVTAWQSAGGAMSNAQYVVYKLAGLAKMLGMPGGEEQAKLRSKAMEMAKSMISAVLIDKEDEYVRENPNFGNMPDMLEMFMFDAASALDMPVTKLFGRSPAGMNATGESDENTWNDALDEYREHSLRPRVQRLVEILLASKEGPTKGKRVDGWRVHFPPLEQLTALERADLRLKTSQADALDIDHEVLLPSEVAISRFRPEGYSTETQIDIKTRERLQKAELKAHEEGINNPPEPPAPGTVPPKGKGVPPAKGKAA